MNPIKKGIHALKHYRTEYYSQYVAYTFEEWALRLFVFEPDYMKTEMPSLYNGYYKQLERWSGNLSTYNGIEKYYE